jgi:predicted translin family RNA/ssDNA-binding protein
MLIPTQRVREDILGLRKDLIGQGYWKYEWSFTPGLQEYIEAVTFYHYLLHGDIPTIEQLSSDLNSVDTTTSDEPAVADFQISLKDYLLGIAGSSSWRRLIRLHFLLILFQI